VTVVVDTGPVVVVDAGSVVVVVVVVSGSHAEKHNIAAVVKTDATFNLILVFSAIIRSI
jgi:hypothetical protein